MTKFTVAGMFAGIGGIEYGLHKAGMETSFLCEVDDKAQAVLRQHFQKAEVVGDISNVESIPRVDLLSAGFPCQDLSQAGLKSGIEGRQSGLVQHIFRILQQQSETQRPEWILFENVSYIISLHGGIALDFLTTSLEKLGYSWGYRIIDTRAFGIPQRRLRMIMVATKTESVRDVLFSQNIDVPPVDDSVVCSHNNWGYGFYWTEGERGIGWTPNGIPTLKVGSKIGIPSPPAIWVPERDFFGTLSITDAERIQGFDPGWTQLCESLPSAKRGDRWKQVGNAVCTPMATWIGSQILNPTNYKGTNEILLSRKKWPKACWGKNGKKYEMLASTWPVALEYKAILDFLDTPLKPLSIKGAKGFYTRARRSTYINYPEEFLVSLERYLKKQEEAQ